MNLIEHYRLQIDQAARGCVSGTLAEWPHLSEALRQHGYFLANSTPAIALKGICQRIIQRGWSESEPVDKR